MDPTTYSPDDERADPKRPAPYSLERLRRTTLAALRDLADEEAERRPAWEQVEVPAKTLSDLEWPALVAELARGAVSDEGAALAARIEPLAERGAVERRMDEITEYQALLSEDDAPPLRGILNIRKAVRHAERGGVLGGEDLYAIGRNCDVVARAARYFGRRRRAAPLLAEVADALAELDDLRETLGEAVEPSGELSDRASADLKRLRRAVRNAQDRVRSEIERLLADPSMEQHLQDDYFTVREERYVVPVRSGARGEVGGIVHGYSSSGQTAFLEPEALVALNNALRWAQIELQEEIDRVLARLSALVGRWAGALFSSMDALAYLDFTGACAQLARRLEAKRPSIVERGADLKRARHPLLYLKFAPEEGDELATNATVPNDVALNDTGRVLVISGPNTGGKTVFLKTFGLAALMARCGLPIAADEGSRIALFSAIYTDIGDEQSLERDLSTFSGHLLNIESFLGRVGPDSLVLLDELFTGTDPMQGAALAVALLERLAQIGATTCVTTHLEGLKTLAFQKSDFVNASMGFDLETLSPTYRVLYGIPGSSYALRIAERLEFPASIVERARRVLEGEDHQSVEDVLTQLEDKRAEMERQARRLDHAREEADRAKRKFQKKLEQITAQDKKVVGARAKRIADELERARSMIKSQIAALQKAGAADAAAQRDLEEARESLRGLDEAVGAARDWSRPPQTGPDGLARIAPEDLAPGTPVYAHAFKRRGEIVAYEQGAEEASVQLGALKVRIPLADLYHPTESARRQRGRRQAPAEPPEASDELRLLPQTTQNSVDLRGLRVDEALEKLELFLDAAWGSNQTGVYIIHGHGSGALKRAVRGQLPSSRYVRDARPGERGEGGDGVTIAYLSDR